MGHRQEMRSAIRPLPKRRQIQPEAFADAALGIFNLAVYLVGGQVDKACRYLKQQRLESQSLFQFMFKIGFGLFQSITI
jgi:hypothetical protein